MRSLMLTLIIWTIAFAAITISASLTYTWYSNRGPEIRISFKNTSGLIPNQSKIMYRGAEVGRVTNIYLDHKTENVLVYARMSRQSSKLIGEESKFWIVRPEFSMEKISNLHAIATGVYINLEPVKGKLVKRFIGLEDAPLDSRLAAGLKIKLRAKTLGGIDPDTPLLYRGLPIGEVWEIGLTKNRNEALITLYVYEEYADLIRKSSYFADISGFHANISIFGKSKIAMDSLQTLLSGGINVYTPNLKGPRAKNGDVYKMLSADELLDLQNR